VTTVQADGGFGDLEIIYQDDYLVAINKPAGLLVHRSAIDTGERRFALQLLRDQIGQRVYPVHRLDKPTSGALLFALQSETARLLSRQFAEQQIHKTYLAVVRGVPDLSGCIDYPLKEQLDPIADAKANRDKGRQATITRFHQLASVELPFAVGRYATSRYSLVKLEPKTGRKHQLRRHMKHIFHPIVGDTTHGEGRHNRLFREQFNSHRMLLHATHMLLIHPHSRENLQIVARPDEILEQLLNKLTFASDPLYALAVNDSTTPHRAIEGSAD